MQKSSLNQAGKGFCNKRSFLQKSMFAHERKTKQETCLVLVNKNKKKGGQDYKLMMKKSKNTTGIPSSEIDSLARALLPTIQELFEKEETKKEFEKWQAERKSKQLHKQTKDD